MNNGVLIALGLGAVAAALVYSATKKDENKLSRVPTGTYDPNLIARRSPGQPQPGNYYIPGLRYTGG